MDLKSRAWEWLRKRLRTFLGIDQLQSQVGVIGSDLRTLESWLGDKHAIEATAVDLHMKGDSESLIIVCSKLKGGMIKFIPVEFRDFGTLMNVIGSLEERFEPRHFYIDGPQVLVREIDDQMKRHKRRRI